VNEVDNDKGKRNFIAEFERCLDLGEVLESTYFAKILRVVFTEVTVRKKEASI
jgi:hypothetical protein